jgi:uncharacterized protein (TIGR03067 family)
MRPIAVSLLALVISNPIYRDRQRQSRPLDPLQGEWLLLETADQHRSDRGDAEIRMRIQGDDVTMMFGEVTTNQGTIALGTSNVLKTIDFKLANGRTVLGIYQIERDVLTICADDAVNGRPVTFAPQGKQWVERWKPSRR